MELTIEIAQKVCSKCLSLKLIEEFNFRNKQKRLRHSYCRECGKLFTQNHYKRNKQQYFAKNLRSYRKRREFVRQMKSCPCADCGVQYPYYVMDFDHREGESKEYALNQVDRMTMRAIKLEIEKSDVVYANCHRERTYQRKLKI